MNFAKRVRFRARSIGCAIVGGALLISGFSVVAIAPAQATSLNFTNRTTVQGLGNNFVSGVFAVGSTVYAATTGGLSISTNGGAGFTNRTTTDGLGGNEVRGVYADGLNVYAATNSGLSISTNGGTSFTNRTTVQGLGSNSVRGVFAVGSTVYAATDGGLAISTNGGSSFINRTSADGLVSAFVRGVYADGLNVYAATTGGLAISTNGGTSFTNRTTVQGLGNDIVNGVFVVGSTVYAATEGGLSISTNGGTSFTNRTTVQGLGNNDVRGVFVVGSTVYAATAGGVSISTDGGASFINRTSANGLGNTSVYGVYAVGSAVYAATTNGLSISLAITPSVSSVSGTVGSAVTPVTFTASGFTADPIYSISPSLPTGLTLNSSSGAISGTPTVTSASTAYTITAESGSESATATVTIAVAAAPDPGPGPGPAPGPAPSPTPTPTPSPEMIPNFDPITSAQNSNIPSSGLSLGETVLLINGVLTVVTVRPDPQVNPTGVIVEGKGFSIRLDGLSIGNEPLALSGGGVLALEQNGTAAAAGFGFSAGTPVYVWLFSQPRLLSTLTVDADGAFGGTVPIPGDVPVGRHTLQINGLTPEGQVRSLSLGIQVTAAPERPMTTKATISFAPASATLDASAKRTLRGLVKGRAKTTVRTVVIGYAHSNNWKTANRALAQRRANAVITYVKSLGVTGTMQTQVRRSNPKTGAAGRKAVVTITYRK